MLKNTKIKTSLLMGFGITILISVLIIISTLLMMNSQSRQMTDVINTEIKACDLIKSSRIHANIAARNLRNILLLPNNPNNSQMLVTTQDALTQLDADMVALAQVYPLNDNQLSEYTQAINSWKQAANDILTAATSEIGRAHV